MFIIILHENEPPHMMRDNYFHKRTHLIPPKSTCKKQESCIIPVSLVHGNLQRAVINHCTQHRQYLVYNVTMARLSKVVCVFWFNCRRRVYRRVITMQFSLLFCGLIAQHE